jgi:hypothetical protein
MEKKNLAILLQASASKNGFVVVMVCTDSQDVIHNNSNVKLFIEELFGQKDYLITYRSSSYLQHD